MQESCTCGSVRGAQGNLRPYRDTKPTQTTRITERRTQEKAFRINTATHLEKSAGWRFESSPVHHSFQVQTGHIGDSPYRLHG
jgi:hypothetical protein